MDQKNSDFNFFFFKRGGFWKKREKCLEFDEFKINFKNQPHYCNCESDLDISKIQYLYSNYVSLFNSKIFPVYKKSKLHQALNLCNNNSKLEFYLDRGFNIDSARLRLNLRQNTVSLDSFVRRFGEINGKERYDNYVKKWKSSISKLDKKELYKNWKNTPENYINKINPETGKSYTYEEAELKIKGDLSKGFKRVWSEYRKGIRPKTFVNTTLEYYEYRGMTSDQAVMALKERQATFTLEKCIHKYGLESGTERFNRRNKQWLETLDSKSDEEKKTIMLSKTRNFCRYSKESMDFFNSVLERLGNSVSSSYDIFMGKREMVLWNYVDKKPYFFDFSIPYLKIIIEYNGSVFHPDPQKLTEEQFINWRCPFTKLTGSEKYKRDKEKLDFAKSLGYEILVVWDHEESEKKIEKCINLIKQKQNEKKPNN